MTAPSPVAAWDPIPRPPRRTASWLALLFVLAGGGYAYHAAPALVGARYPALRDDVCLAVGVSPVLKLFQGPIGPPTPVDGPIPETTRSCRFSVTRSDGVTPRAAGEVTVYRFPYAAVARIAHGRHREDAARTIYQRDEVRDLAGLGEEAFTHHDTDGGFARFRVGARDSNLLVEIRLLVAPDDPALSPDRPGLVLETLADGIRTSFRQLR